MKEISSSRGNEKRRDTRAMKEKEAEDANLLQPCQGRFLLPHSTGALRNARRIPSVSLLADSRKVF